MVNEIIIKLNNPNVKGTYKFHVDEYETPLVETLRSIEKDIKRLGRSLPINSNVSMIINSKEIKTSVQDLRTFSYVKDIYLT